MSAATTSPRGAAGVSLRAVAPPWLTSCRRPAIALWHARDSEHVLVEWRGRGRRCRWTNSPKLPTAPVKYRTFHAATRTKTTIEEDQDVAATHDYRLPGRPSPGHRCRSLRAGRSAPDATPSPRGSTRSTTTRAAISGKTALELHTAPSSVTNPRRPICAIRSSVSASYSPNAETVNGTRRAPGIAPMHLLRLAETSPAPAGRDVGRRPLPRCNASTPVDLATVAPGSR